MAVIGDRRGTMGPRALPQTAGLDHRPLRLQSAPKEPDVRFPLIRLNRIPSHDGMRRAGTDVSDKADEPEEVVVDEDPPG